MNSHFKIPEVPAAKTGNQNSQKLPPVEEGKNVEVKPLKGNKPD